MSKFDPLQSLPYIASVYVYTRALKWVLCMLLRTLSHSVKQTTEVADSRAISEEFSCLLLNSKIKWAGHVARVTERRIS